MNLTQIAAGHRVIVRPAAHVLGGEMDNTENPNGTDGQAPHLNRL